MTDEMGGRPEAPGPPKQAAASRAEEREWSRPRARLPRPSAFLLLLALPAALVSAALSVRDARGPAWLSGNLDPTYPYLMNSLNVANLHRPFHTDHPGTTVQVAGGLIIRSLNPLAGEEETAREVLSRPEHYIRLISNCLIIFYAVCMVAAGLAALVVTRNAALAMLFQATPFISMTTVLALTGVRPEPLLAALSLLFASALLLTLRFEVSGRPHLYALVFGLLFGLGMASKVSFAPLAIIPLLLLPGFRIRAEFCAASVATFLLAVFPILTPVLVRNSLGFYSRILTHTGRYGEGERGLVDLRKFAPAALDLVAGDWLFFSLVAAGTLLLVHGLKSGRPRGATHKALLAATVCALFQLVVVAKHPGAHYLTPALGLAGCYPLLLCAAFSPRGRAGSRARARAAAAVIVLLTFVQAARLYELRAALAESAREQLAVREKVDREFRGEIVVNYYSSSSLPYALKFGAEFSNNIYGSILEGLYPGHFFYNLWMGGFSDFVGPVDRGRLESAGGTFIMHGYSLERADFRPYLAARGNLVLENVYGGKVDRPDEEKLYRARFAPTQ